MLWRQGDIFIETIPLIPAAATQQSHLVLADGELTGHSHRVADPDTALLFAHREDLFLQVIADEADVIHQEHGTVTLPRGRYRVWRQREYDPKPARPSRVGHTRVLPQQEASRWVID